MLNRVFALLLLSIVITIAKCDTIDFWHVYYNKERKLICNEQTLNALLLDRGSIKDEDSIIIYYYNDSGCSYCKSELLTDTSGKTIYEIKPKEPSFRTTMVIPAKLLKQSSSNSFTLNFAEKKYWKILTITLK